MSLDRKQRKDRKRKEGVSVEGNSNTNANASNVEVKVGEGNGEAVTPMQVKGTQKTPEELNKLNLERIEQYKKEIAAQDSTRVGSVAPADSSSVSSAVNTTPVQQDVTNSALTNNGTTAVNTADTANAANTTNTANPQEVATPPQDVAPSQESAPNPNPNPNPNPSASPSNEEVVNSGLVGTSALSSNNGNNTANNGDIGTSVVGDTSVPSNSVENGENGVRIGVDLDSNRHLITGLPEDIQGALNEEYRAKEKNINDYYDGLNKDLNDLYDNTLNPSLDKQESMNRSYLDKLVEYINEAERERAFLDSQDEEAVKRARSAQMINAMGDGFSALSNLFATIKGADPVDINSKDNLTTRYRALYDDAKAKRDKLFEENKERLLKQRELYDKSELQHGLTFQEAREKLITDREKALKDYEENRRKELDLLTKERVEREDKAIAQRQAQQRLDDLAESKREANRIKAQLAKDKDKVKAKNDWLRFTKDRYGKTVAYIDANGEKYEVLGNRLESIVMQNFDELRTKANEKVNAVIDVLNQVFKDTDGQRVYKKGKKYPIINWETMEFETDAQDNIRYYQGKVDGEDEVKKYINEVINKLAEYNNERRAIRSVTRDKLGDAYKVFLKYAKDVEAVDKQIKQIAEQDRNLLKAIEDDLIAAGIDLKREGLTNDLAQQRIEENGIYGDYGAELAEKYGITPVNPSGNNSGENSSASGLPAGWEYTTN